MTSAMTSLSHRIYRSKKYKTIGGVCAGVALARGWSISLVRVVTLLLTSASGLGLVAYLAGWVLLPSWDESPNAEPKTPPEDPFRRSTTDRKIGGVCGGLAALLGVDPGMLRVFTVLLVFLGGMGIVPYIYGWLVVPPDSVD